MSDWPDKCVWRPTWSHVKPEVKRLLMVCSHMSDCSLLFQLPLLPQNMMATVTLHTKTMPLNLTTKVCIKSTHTHSTIRWLLPCKHKSDHLHWGIFIVCSLETVIATSAFFFLLWLYNIWPGFFCEVNMSVVIITCVVIPWYEITYTLNWISAVRTSHSFGFARNRSSLVSYSETDQWGGGLPLSSRRGPQEHTGHPLWDELRPRVPTGGEELDSVPRQPPLVWDRLVPQYVEKLSPHMKLHFFVSVTVSFFHRLRLFLLIFLWFWVM